MSLGQLMTGRTCFVIAHRLSTIRNAGHIVVLEHGRIVEQGTHDDLMNRSGRYRFMVELQTHSPIPAQSRTVA
jgi:ABC-type multidrug transport system fused ATPase/permease subunit